MALLALAAYVGVFTAVVYLWRWMFAALELPDSPSLPISLTMVILTLVILVCGLLAKMDFARV
jgi:hypothetical protein